MHMCVCVSVCVDHSDAESPVRCGSVVFSERRPCLSHRIGYYCDIELIFTEPKLHEGPAVIRHTLKIHKHCGTACERTNPQADVHLRVPTQTQTRIHTACAGLAGSGAEVVY